MASAFEYQALDKQGKRKKGVLEADTASQVRQKLREMNLVPLSVDEVVDVKAGKASGAVARRLGGRKRIASADLALLTRQLATLLEARIPLDEALTGVVEQSEKAHVKSILLGVRSRVLEGHSLAAAMDAFPTAFPKLYRTTVASGERSGQLDLVLSRLADFTERQHEVKQKVVQAMIYPSLMTLVSIGVVVFLLIYVVPKIINVFTQTHQSLPLSTQILVGISHFLRVYGLYLLAALVAVIVIFMLLLKKNEGFRFRFHQFLLKLPIIGRGIRTVNGARFARTFGILTAATVPVLDGMKAATQMVVPLPMRQALEIATDRVREGTYINKALQKTGFFAPMFVHLVASGEASGQLESMLAKAAGYQEREVEGLIQGSLTLFEPMMILVMGGIVLFIVLAVMLPIFSMDQFNFNQ